MKKEKRSFDVTIYSADAEDPILYEWFAEIPTWLTWARRILEYPTFEELTYTCGVTQTRVVEHR